MDQCRRRQRHLQAAGRFQHQGEILVHPLERKLGIKAALQDQRKLGFDQRIARHAGLQHFQHQRGRNTRLARQHKTLCHGLDRERSDQVLRQLHLQARAVAADMKYLLAHHGQIWLNTVKGLFLTADHKGERGAASAGFASGAGSVEETHAALAELLRQRAAGVGGYRARIHHHRARRYTLQQASADFLHRLRVAHTQENDLCPAADLSRRVGHRRAALAQRFRFRATAVVDCQSVARFQQILRHRASHDPQANKTQLFRL